MALILLIFNSVLAIVALFNMFTVVEQVKVTAEIQYSRFWSCIPLSRPSSFNADVYYAGIDGQ